MIDLHNWRTAEVGISRQLHPTLSDPRVAPLWRATDLAVHILYSSCAQHAVPGPCAHSADEHVLMWLGGRVLTNTLAAVRLLVVGYYGPSVALVRDNIETTMLLGLFEAAPQELAAWRDATDPKQRWRSFSPRAVRKKLTALNVWHRYDDYDLYTGWAGHPTPSPSRLFFSEERQRRMVGPFADAESAEVTLHAVMLASAHGAFQIVDVLKVDEQFKTETEELHAALQAWISSQAKS